MQSIDFQTHDISGGAGYGAGVSGVLDAGPFELGGMEYGLPGGIAYKLMLSNVGDAIVLTGSASAEVRGSCSRCLEPCSLLVDTDVDGYFALSEDSDVSGMSEDEYEIVGPDGVVDLADSVFSAVAAEVPMIFLCDEGCKGLCPKCGANLNVEGCDCDQMPDETSPFAVLKDFFEKA